MSGNSSYIAIYKCIPPHIYAYIFIFLMVQFEITYPFVIDFVLLDLDYKNLKI